MNLKPYQVAGAQFLAARKFAFLADQMGLGKSAQAIRGCDLVHAKTVVVICPAVARVNWQREFELWGQQDRHVFVYSYDKVATDARVRASIEAAKPDVLICDEAHYLKTRSTKRTIAIYGKGCKNNGVAQHATRVWLLTGTPCPNDAGELFPHLRALWPETIKKADGAMNYVEFINRYCVVLKTPFGDKIIGNKNAAELRSILATFMLRRKAGDVLKELPAINWAVTPIEPDHVLSDLPRLEQTPEVEALRTSLNDGVLPESGLVALATLRRVTGLAKAGVAARMLREELESDAYQKIVVFVQHLDVGKTLMEQLSAYGTVFLNGSTTPTMKQKMIDDFQRNPEVRVFVGQLQACSTAITLHAANQVLFVEQSWTPSDNAQAAKRCHRIGQTRPVFVRMLGLAKSIDEAVARVLARKTQAIAEILE